MEIKDEGVCRFCLKTFSGPSMGRHLLACKEKQQKDSENLSKKKTSKPIYHIKIWSYKPFWLHIEMNSNSTLFDLDDFLKDIWLECCGHLSDFKIQGVRYIGYEDDDMWGATPRSMGEPINKVLNVKDTFEYVYDFGSSTCLQGKILAERDGVITKKVRILARNNLPALECNNCQDKATEICPFCDEIFCDKCITEHGCDEDVYLPIVNSPRMGVCGYTGEYDFDNFKLTN
jgi:hypothetical protein